MTKPLVFISYSHKDKKWKDILVKHLQVLQLEGFYDIWDDKRINAGEDWYNQIKEVIETAKVAVFLISVDFLTSKFIRSKEVPPLLERRKKGGLCIFPVIIRPCAWDETSWLAKIQARPEDGKPLSEKSKSQAEKDLAAIAKEIKFIIQQAQEKEEEKSIARKSYIPPPLPAYPPQLKEFVIHNRADELTKAFAYLEDHSILLISGMGGIGKTTLARALVDMRPDSVPLPFWFDFGKKMDAKLEDVLEHLAGYLNVPDIARFKNEKRDAGQEDIDRLIYELQNHEPVWLVFDNLETILEGTRFHDQDMDSIFTSLRESNHNAKVIVTSRTLPVLGSGESLIDMVYEEKQELKGLKINDAVDYLIKNGLGDVKREELEKLANGVDGHPLALELLIPLVKKFSIEDTLKDLSMYQEQKEGTIKKARRLFDKLAGDEKELLERISVFRRPELLGAIKAMFTDKTSKDAIGNLLDKSLLETDHKGNYRLHPLVREFSYGDLKDKREVHKLAYEYYLSLPLQETRTKKEDVQSLIEAHYHACIAQDYDRAANIIFGYKLYDDLDRWGNYRALIELYTGVLPKDHFKDKPLMSNMGVHRDILVNLANTYVNLGQMDRAREYYEKVRVISEEIGDRQGEGISIGGLGLAYYSLGQMEKAIEYYEKALIIAREIRDRYNEVTWLGNLGNAYKNLGQVEKAIEYYEKARVIAKGNKDRRREGIVLGNLGLAYHSLNQMEKAIEYHEMGLVIAREIGDRQSEGYRLNNLGLALKDENKYREMLACYLLAKGIRKEIKDPNIKTTESNLNELKDKLGEKEFEKLLAEVAPEAEEIVKKILDGTLK